MERNILNLDGVEAFLAPLMARAEIPEVRRWLEGTARRWIVKFFPDCGRVTEVQRHHSVPERGQVAVCWPDGRRTRHTCTLPA